MKKAVTFFIATLLALVFSGAAPADDVKFQIKGAYCPGCVKVLTKALGEVPGVKLEGKLKAAKEEVQQVTVDLDTAKADVGDVAKAIAASKTPHKDKVEPVASLVVTQKGVTKDDTQKVRKVLADVKGVVAKECSAGEGQIIISLDNEGGARLSEITKALKKLTD